MSSEHLPRHEDLLPSYCLGALDGEDLAELRRHLEGRCPECEQLLAGWQASLEAIAGSVEPVAPSETARARLLRALPSRRGSAHAGAPRGSAMRQRRGALWGGLAASVLALLVAGWSLVEQRRLEQEVALLRAERSALERRLGLFDSQLERARSEIGRLGNALRLVNAPHTRSVILAGRGPSPRASATAYLRPQAGRAIVYAYELPPLAPDQSYQLWYIDERGPVSAGILELDDSGAAVLEVEGLPDLAAIRQWAVTIEPAGGVSQPTGEMVLSS